MPGTQITSKWRNFAYVIRAGSTDGEKNTISEKRMWGMVEQKTVSWRIRNEQLGYRTKQNGMIKYPSTNCIHNTEQCYL